MVALLNPSATPLRKKDRLAPIAEQLPPKHADVIWNLHRTVIDPLAEGATVKRAKGQLLRAVTAADNSLPIIVPPLAAKDIRRLPIHDNEKHCSD
jgi:hypothetical protein